LLAPLREDLGGWRRASRLSPPTAPVFPAAAGGFWRATDWRNWRKRSYRPVGESVGPAGARPYDLRHAFASLLIHEGRLSVVEIAAQLGHNPRVCLDTYAHVMAEARDGEHVTAEEWASRRGSRCRRNQTQVSRWHSRASNDAVERRAAARSRQLRQPGSASMGSPGWLRVPEARCRRCSGLSTCSITKGCWNANPADRLLRVD
jgi:hypothetical protein